MSECVCMCAHIYTIEGVPKKRSLKFFDLKISTKLSEKGS